MMSDTTDTSAEAVERLAAGFDATVFAAESPILRSEYQRTAATLRALRAERDGWIEAAAQHLRNEEWMRGLLEQIGALFGDAARTSDDGSVQDSVLLLRVPELAAAMKAERDRLRGAQDAAARVLHKAGEQFAFYANEHAKKGTPDGDVKAATNQQWAQRCFNAHDVALKEPAHD
jgi:hypothetical protein